MIFKKKRKKTQRPWHSQFWGLHAKPSKISSTILSAIPFTLLIAIYIIASTLRHSANPDDKLLPTVMQMLEAIKLFTYNQDELLGGSFFQWLWNPKILPQLRQFVTAFIYSDFVQDTFSSFIRIFCGLTLSTILGLLVGLNMGLFAGFRDLLKPTTVVVSNIPPLAVLPILLIVFQVGEMSKIMLIFIGTFPVITMSVYFAVKAIPWEVIIKSLTLGASEFGVTYRVILPRIMPNLLNTVSLTLGAAWLFLISAEAIAATSGLGYRIFLVRRYLMMDIIIPYVLWITFLAYQITKIISRFISKHYRWFDAQNGGLRK